MDVQKMKKKKIVMGCLLVFGLGILCFLLNVFNVYTLQFNVKENEPIVVECGMSNTLPNVEAIYKGNLLLRGGKSVDVTMEGEVNLEQIGRYPVVYSASHKGVETSISTVIEL